MAAYYSSQTTSAGLTDEALRAAGELLYRGGNAETDIPACMSCHGPAGEGNPLSGYPSLQVNTRSIQRKCLTASVPVPPGVMMMPAARS